MNKYEKLIIGIAIISIFVFLSKYLDLKCSNPNFKTKIDTIAKVQYKERLKIDTLIIPKWNIVKQNIYISDTIYRIDTITKIVTKYLTKNVYKDTILNDTNGLIVLTDTIYKNKIKDRKTQINLYKKTKIIQPRINHFFITCGSQLHQEMNVSFGLKYSHKKNMFGANYSTNKIISLEYSYRLR